MASVQLRTYTSPTLVLLAFDWPDGKGVDDFLGFAIRRSPGFDDKATSWLPNRIGFSGPVLKGKADLPTDEAPVQKFMWWDARIDAGSSGKKFQYAVTPVRGKPGHLTLLDDATGELDVTVPEHVVNGVGTWFNRAVVSSQAFARMLEDMGVTKKKPPTEDQALALRKWLANGVETVIPTFFETAKTSKHQVAGAIYHLTDELWVIPAVDTFAGHNGNVELVYDSRTDKNGKNPNQSVIENLKDRESIVFKPRNKTHIMHNKFLVRGVQFDDDQAEPTEVLCGSANFTTEGLTTQANLLHTFESAELAQDFLNRERLIRTNPTIGQTSKATKWSSMRTVGDAGVRVFFSPEPKDQRESIDTIVSAIHEARSSVLFCLFMPTDAPLRDACFAAGDNDKMMFGLVNNISDKEGEDVDEDMRADTKAAIEIYHRSRDNKDVVPASYFGWDDTPKGFESEQKLFPGTPAPNFPPVIIHHKFIIIDAETTSPVIFSGSANMSKNSVNFNDENLLEIRGGRRLAATYLAEFMRLYEHYRARAYWAMRADGGPKNQTFQLAADASWCKKHFKPGTPEFKSRVAMASV